MIFKNSTPWIALCLASVVAVVFISKDDSPPFSDSKTSGQDLRKPQESICVNELVVPVEKRHPSDMFVSSRDERPAGDIKPLALADSRQVHSEMTPDEVNSGDYPVETLLPKLIENNQDSAATTTVTATVSGTNARQKAKDIKFTNVPRDIIEKSGPPEPQVFASTDQNLFSKLEYAKSLARKGASASAQKEFTLILNLFAQQRDAISGSTHSSDCLRKALLALEEANGFFETTDALQGMPDVTSVVERHQSQILSPSGANGMTTIAAAQAYYNFAREMFHESFGKSEIASHALYSLGKLYSLEYQKNSKATEGLSAKIMLLLYSAMDCDRKNFPAANELGVMLAKNGNLVEARDILLYGIKIHPTVTAWENLAHVHVDLGEKDLAMSAELEAKLLAEQSSANGMSNAIRFVEPQEFATMPDNSGDTMMAMHDESISPTVPDAKNLKSNRDRSSGLLKSFWK